MDPNNNKRDAPYEEDEYEEDDSPLSKRPKTTTSNVEGEDEFEETEIVTEEIHLPSKLFGKILGRYGAEMTRLQEESKCKIELSQLDEHGAIIEKPLKITGTPSAIEKAKALISEKMETDMQDVVNETVQIPVVMCGLLIGKNGENIRKMNQESNCSMLLGQVATNGSKPLQICGTRSEVDFAKRLVHIALQKPIALEKGPEQKIVEIIMIPQDFCGSIIGKAGENIKKFRSWTNCDMSIIQDNNQPTAPKPLRIIGYAANVEKAKRLVNAHLEQLRENQSSQPPASFMAGNSALTKTVEIRIPRSAVGAVMGLQGRNIRTLADQTGVKIQFLQDSDPAMQERGLVLIGAEHKVTIAIELIKGIVEQNRPPDATTLFFLEIPASKCGLVIGKGGSTIKRVSMKTGSHCVLSRESNSSDSKTIVIRGNEYQVEHAKHQLLQILGDIPPNTPFRFRIASQTTPPSLPVPKFVQGPPILATPTYFHAKPMSSFPQTLPVMNTPTFFPSQHNSPISQTSSTLAPPKYFPSQPITPYAPSSSDLTPPTFFPSQPVSQYQTQASPITPRPESSETPHTDYSHQWLQYYLSIGDTEGADAVKARIMKNLVSR